MALALSTTAYGAVAVAAMTLFLIGTPAQRAREAAQSASPDTSPPPAAQAPAEVAAAGITLRSVSLTLPVSDRTFPGGPAADAINANCLTCHSAGMVLNQPLMSRAAWQDEVAKMRMTYKAPIDPDAVPAIASYLASLKPGGS